MKLRRLLPLMLGTMVAGGVWAPHMEASEGEPPPRYEDARGAEDVSTSPDVITVEAVPPPDADAVVKVASATPPAKPVRTAKATTKVSRPAAPSGAGSTTSATDEGGATAASDLPLPARFVNGTPAINRDDDLPRLTFDDLQGPNTAMAFDQRMVHGQFVQSSDDLHEARRLHVQYGYLTVIRFANGEQPTGTILCGSCGDPSNPQQMAALSIDRVGDIVVVKPRAYSHPDHGVISSNFSVETVDRTGMKHLYMFTAIEVTSLVDGRGQQLVRTDYHEIRSGRATPGTAIGDTFESRVGEVAKGLEVEYQKALARRNETMLGEKAQLGMQILSDFKVEKRHGGRKLVIESAATVGDETVIKMYLIGAQEALTTDPVAYVDAGAYRYRRLPHRSVFMRPATYRGKEALEITLTIQAAKLKGKQRLIVAVVDAERREEFASSAGLG